MCIGEGMQ
ncbi:hypothetical protein A2U01_0063524, partial [Trifolium medium]|nr:hypothetical protein [Trifolium medium]